MLDVPTKLTIALVLFFYQIAQGNSRLHWRCQWARSRYACFRRLLKKHQLIYQFLSWDEIIRQFRTKSEKKIYNINTWVLFLNKLSAQMVRGNSLLSALKSLQHDIRLPKHFIYRAVNYLENGMYIYPLWESENVPLPYHCKKLLQCAETGGYLSEGLKKVITFLNLQADAKHQLQRCLIYPCCVLCVSILFTGVLTLSLIPKIENFCYQQNLTINQLTASLFALSHHFFAIMGGVIAFFMLLLLLLRMKKISLRPYFFEKLTHSLQYSLFAMNLSALMSSGLALAECLKLTLPIFKGKFSLDKILLNLGNGQKLSEALAQFPTEFRNILQTAEISGQYLPALESLSDMYYRRYQNTLQQWIKWIEPLSIIFVAGFVFVVLLILFYPLLQTFENLPLM